MLKKNNFNKINIAGSKKTSNKSPNKSILNMFNIKSPNNKKKAKKDADSVLNSEEKQAIEADVLNKKLWGECLEVCEKSGKKVRCLCFA